MKRNKSGFTLIEVLLALTVIAIALTALLRAMSQTIDHTHRIKEKTISHWIAMQGITMVQLNLVQLNSSQESTQVTTMFNQRWYWRAKLSNTSINALQKITISTSTNQSGPFREELTGFKYTS